MDAFFGRGIQLLWRRLLTLNLEEKENILPYVLYKDVVDNIHSRHDSRFNNVNLFSSKIENKKKVFFTEKKKHF